MESAYNIQTAVMWLELMATESDFETERTMLNIAIDAMKKELKNMGEEYDY